MKKLPPIHPDLGWTPYVWLIYLASVFVKPARAGASAWEWAATIAGALVFLVLYVLGYRLPPRPRLLAAGGILLLGVIFVPFNPGAIVYFIYGVSFFGHALRPGPALRLLLLVVAVEILLAWWFSLPLSTWASGILFSLMVGGINIHFGEVARANTRLRASQEEIERLAKTAERERIARDLHDLLGHTLSLVALKAELAGKLVDRDPERAREEIREVERISREALREVRNVVGGYRSEGLTAELVKARLLLDTAGIELAYFLAPVDLDPAREAVLALALREAVTNVVRHAGASTCRITLEPSETEVRLEVRDDGKGTRAPEGIGLSGMRARIEGLGGEVNLRADGGTVLTVTLPRPVPRTSSAGPATVTLDLAPEGSS
jgi:two-component system sensor histidine kinase DesK